MSIPIDRLTQAVTRLENTLEHLNYNAGKREERMEALFQGFDHRLTVVETLQKG